MSSIHTDLPLEEVLCSGSGRLVKWRLVSTPPGSGSDSGGRKHSQTGWSQPSPVPWLPCQAPWGSAGFQEPRGGGAGGERRRGRAGRRSGDTARPAEGRHLGKGLAPVDSGCSSRSPTKSRGVLQARGVGDQRLSRTHLRSLRPAGVSPPLRGPAARGRRAELPALRGGGLRGSPGAGKRAAVLASGHWSGLEPGPGRAGPGGKLDRSPCRPPGQGWERAVQAPASSPSGRCAFVSGAFPEPGARRRLQNCGASRWRGRWPHFAAENRQLGLNRDRHGRAATPTYRLVIHAAPGSRACSHLESNHPGIGGASVCPPRRGLWSPQCVSARPKA